LRRRVQAILSRAALTGAFMTGAVCAPARTAFAFEDVPRLQPVHAPHRAAYACAFAGVGLIGLSFPLTDAANRRYDEYLHESRPEAIPDRWNRTVWADRETGAAVIGGEALIATAVWLRFLHHPRDARGVSLALGPSRCALRCSF